MNLEQLSEIRISIGNTIAHIRAEPPEPTRTALQTHLDALLKEELRALTGQALDGESHVKLNLTLDTTDLRAELARLQARLAALKAEKHTTPWYPDNSGEWVEVPNGCTTCPCTPSARIEILVRGERHRQVFRSSQRVASVCLWDNDVGSDCRIVAYKVVKPCE